MGSCHFLMVKLLSWWVWIDYMLDFQEMNVFVFEHGNNSFLLYAFLLVLSKYSNFLYSILNLYILLIIIQHIMSHFSLFRVEVCNQQYFWSNVYRWNSEASRPATSSTVISALQWPVNREHLFLDV